MSGILIFLQQSQGKLSKAALVSISAARALTESWKSGDLIGLCLGEGAGAAANEALDYGLAQSLYSEKSELSNYLAENYSQAAIAALEHSGCQVFLGGSTSLVKDLFPRVAGRIDAGQASDVLSINQDGTLRRPMYAGNVLADVEMLSEKRVITVRLSAFGAADKASRSGSASELAFNLDASKSGEVVEYQVAAAERPELTEAEIVVSGGRALQSSENFQKYIFPLADALGAAVGASRAAVDSGYAPNDWQVGQTGKIVAPALYIAVGISGAIQHLAGMKDSRLIVAINKDADAPIYEVADYGLVADLYQAVPALTEAIVKAKGG